MKKNFLLLFLMALLPLAGWAAAEEGANTVLRFNYEGENAEILGLVDGAELTGGALEIPATVTFAKAGEETKTYKVVKVLADAFKDNVDITSVTFKGNLTEIQAAFTGCKNLATVDFSAATKLTTIAENAFKGTKITALDLSKTKVTAIANLLGTTADVKNESLTEVKLPKTVTSITGTAFLNCTKLAAVTFADDTEATIAEGAFAGTAITTLDLSKTKIAVINRLFGTTADVKYESLTEVKLPKTVTNIVANAFLNCTKLAAVTFADETAATINASAFAGTAIETLDLSKTKVTAIENLFGTTATVKNESLTTVKLPNTVETIAENAFQNCTKLATVTFADLKDGAKNVETIGAGAFAKTAITTLDLTKTKITTLSRLFEDVNNTVKTVKLPATLTTIEEYALAGLGGMETVDFTACKAAITINGNAFNTTVLLKSIELPAGVKLLVNAFAKTYLTTVTFKGDLGEDAVAAGAFVKNGSSQKLTVNYTPSAEGKKIYESFVQSSFAPENADVWVTFNTSTTRGEEVENYATWTKDEKLNKIYGVKLTFVATSTDKTIKVAKKEGVGSYYYGTFITTDPIKIAKKQGEANVMVYGAYVDNAAETAIMMDQLHLIGGYYYIPANVKIIVKSSKEADVVYSPGDGGKDSQNYNGESESQNKIEAADAESFAASIKEANPGKVVYFLAPFAEYGFLWTQFRDERIIPKGQFYLIAEPTAAPARVVWLDGSEEDQVTGIETVETKKAVVDGVTYNLAGQKVDANYKGVVIKNGKKFFQK